MVEIGNLENLKHTGQAFLPSEAGFDSQNRARQTNPAEDKRSPQWSRFEFKDKTRVEQTMNCELLTKNLLIPLLRSRVYRQLKLWLARNTRLKMNAVDKTAIDIMIFKKPAVMHHESRVCERQIRTIWRQR